MESNKNTQTTNEVHNLSIYERARSVPNEALRPITSGRLKGKSDINPMWRLKTLTEIFGPVGIGWKYEIVSKEIIEGANGEKAAFVDINLYIKQNDVWSEAIPGTGGASFVAKETKGYHTSDECFKMALTDAISVACKALGFAADVYWNSDKSKYDVVTEPIQEQSQLIQQYQNPQQPIEYICQSCGKPFVDATFPSGFATAAQQYDMAIKKRGAAICRDCYEKIKAGQ